MAPLKEERAAGVCGEELGVGVGVSWLSLLGADPASPGEEEMVRWLSEVWKGDKGLEFHVRKQRLPGHRTRERGWQKVPEQLCDAQGE